MDISTAEKGLLSILVLEQKKSIDLLQIKPKYLSDKRHALLLEAVIYSKKKYGIIDTSAMMSYKPTIADIIVDVISDDNIPIMNVRKQFMICQKVILDSYKQRRISILTQKLNSGDIDCDMYLKQMEKANYLVIRNETDILTNEEILQNISEENVRINLKKFTLLNRTIELVHNDLLVVGAKTGTGKSAFLINLMNDLMDRYQCIYFNMEMSKSTIYKRMISVKADIPIYDIEYPKSDYQKQLISNAISEIVKNKVVIEHKASYLSEIRTSLALCKNENKHTIIFLDHLGLIQGDNKKTIYEQTTSTLKALRQFCLDYDCTIIAASQLNRSSYNAKVLDVSMLKDSGEIENSASKIILLDKPETQSNKEEYVDDMILRIEKNRNGKIGKIACIYDKTKQIFKEVINYD